MNVDYLKIRTDILVMRNLLIEFNMFGDIEFYKKYIRKDLELFKYIRQFDIKTIEFICKLKSNILRKYFKGYIK